MELHALLSVTATAEQDVYTASVDITDMEGARYTADYISRPGDTFGLAPQVRAAIDQWIADGKTVTPYVAPPVDLVAYAADKRYQVETGGITLNGETIDTSRESQAMITGAYNWSNANPSEPIKFKAATGWIVIDNATMVAIADAVGAHVQACFAVEAAVAADIAAGTITTTAQIDAAVWP